MAAQTTVQGHTSHTQSNDAAAGDDAGRLRASANVARFDAYTAAGAWKSRHHVRKAAERAAGRRGRVEEVDLYTTGDAAEEIGISARRFRSLATKHDVVPVDSYATRAHGARQSCALWSPAQVVALGAQVRPRRAGPRHPSDNLFGRAARAYRARCAREGRRPVIPDAGTSAVATISVLRIFVLRSHDGAILGEYEIGKRGMRWLSAPGPVARQEARARMWPAVSGLNADALVDLGLECIQAANRYAKHLRSACPYDVEGRPTLSKTRQIEIYKVKDTFLAALLRAGRARAETYTIERESRRMYCDNCERDWVGSDWCYGCQQRSGQGTRELERWFVVQAGGYRFHQPSLPADLAAQAVTCEAHDPDQPVREVPTVRFGDAELTLEDQLEVARRASRSLAAADLELDKGSHGGAGGVHCQQPARTDGSVPQGSH